MEGSKQCTKCLEVKPLSEFYTGRAECKACKNKQCGENRRRNPERYAAYSAKYKQGMTEEQRARYKRAKNAGPSKKRSRKNYKQANPEKAKAWKAVHKAKSEGRLVQQPCTRCGATERIEAHHPDHSRRLDVVWLCQDCHNVEHGNVRRTHPQGHP